MAGGIPLDTGKIIAGGPMMGRAIESLEITVAKGLAGVLFIPDKEAKTMKIQPCIRCTQCVTACPMGLEPFLLMSQTEREMWTEMEQDKVMDCIECGCCSYTCPSHRPLLDYIRQGKNTVAGIIRNRKQTLVG
jgi:electron transport complex protein RnfC